MPRFSFSRKKSEIMDTDQAIREDISNSSYIGIEKNENERYNGFDWSPSI